MNCPYCQSFVHEQDHRCPRCARRCGSASHVPMPILTAAAPALDYFVPSERTLPRPELAAATVRADQRVLQFPPHRIGLESAATPEPLQLTVSHAPMALGAWEQARSARPRPCGPTSQESAIYTHHPVAGLMHRAMACALDAGLALAGVGLFLAVLMLARVPVVFDAHSMPVFALACVAIHLFYEWLWAAADVDSPGVRATGLRLLHFDGRAPHSRQRLIRALGGLLGIGAAGLGVLWSVADEETLAWHDHMSGTFLSPAEEPVHRR